MARDLFYEGRRKAFNALVQEVGTQLARADVDSLEVSERVPEASREKGGVKLLEQLWKQGNFSLWRTAGLCDILRKCGRCDLAEHVSSVYQTSFPDLAESPKQKQKHWTVLSEQVPSPLLVVRTAIHSRSTSSPDPQPRSYHRRVPSLDHPPPAEEEGEEHSLFGTHGNTHGFLISKSESELSTGSSYYATPVQEQRRRGSEMNEQRLLHSQTSHEEYRLREKAIDAVVRIATGTTCKSCTDIHSSQLHTPSGEGMKSHSDTHLPLEKEYAPEISTPTLNRRGNDSNRGSASGEGDFVEQIFHESENASPLPYPPTPTPSPEHTVAMATTGGSSRRIKLPRPLSGYRNTRGKITWELKKDRLLKCLAKSGDEKIAFGEKLELDVGCGRQNPKLSLVLYPKGLFITQGKRASLQANISVSDKCPPLSPSLLVELSVTVFSSRSRKQEVWNKCSAQETVNIRSFYIHDLFACDVMVLDAIGDHILLEIAVQIQKAIEEV